MSPPAGEDIAAHGARLDALEKEVAGLRTRWHEVAGAVVHRTEVRHLAERLEERVGAVEQALAALRTEAGSYREDLGAVRADIASLQQTVAALQGKLVGVTAMLALIVPILTAILVRVVSRIG